MERKLYIVGLIPARAGSKGIKNKNIKLLNGKPLIYYSIKQSLECSLIDDTVVTTDSEEIAEISKSYGALVPFLRPKEISEDLSTDIEFVKHYLNFLEVAGKKIPDLIVQLRPTCPDRKPEHITDSIQVMIKNYDSYDSLRSVTKLDKSPFKMYLIRDGQLKPLFREIDGKKEPYNLCRQDLPQAFIHNGYIDIIKTDTVKQKNSITGESIYPYVLDDDEFFDIDTEKDWKNYASIVDNKKRLNLYGGSY